MKIAEAMANVVDGRLYSQVLNYMVTHSNTSTAVTNAYHQQYRKKQHKDHIRDKTHHIASSRRAKVVSHQVESHMTWVLLEQRTCRRVGLCLVIDLLLAVLRSIMGSQKILFHLCIAC